MDNPIKNILIEIGYDLMDRGKNYRAKPLYRDSDSGDVLSIDKESGVWYDFKERKGGKFEELVRLSLKQGDVSETKEWLKSRTNGYAIVRNKKPEIKTPKKYSKEILLKLQKDHSYWLGRNIDKETLEVFDGGLANSGQMANRYVFPIFNSQDDLVGFTGRYVKEIPKEFKIPKWKHVGTVSNWCYPLKHNLKDIREAKKVILVESVGDMLSLWNAGIKYSVVTFGLTISKAITIVLLKMDVQKVIISFNNDSQNNHAGNKAAEKAASRLYYHFDKQQVRVALPTKNDFGEMTRKEIQQWCSTALGDV
jgi:DNA primase